MLEESVRIRLMSEVPIGAFLSGGPDSSLIVAYMSSILKQPVKTFTVAFDESKFDESKDALRVAEHCGTEHHVKTISFNEMQKDFFSTIDTIVRHTDQPFGDSSALPTYYISRLAREELTVILGGDGADEAFCGYNHYKALRFAEIYQLLPESFRLKMVPPLVSKWVNFSSPGTARWRANSWQNRLTDSNLPLSDMMANKYAVTSIAICNQLMPEISSFLSSNDYDGEYMIPFGDSANPFQKLQYADLMFHQLNDMLVKIDRMSMANSLEVRSPYLDHKIN
jgi:asparagine synthase (glutamine-hydrolysing)